LRSAKQFCLSVETSAIRSQFTKMYGFAGMPVAAGRLKELPKQHTLA
jgi:hypothetical protein